MDVFFEKAKTYLGISADWFLEVFISTALIAVLFAFLLIYPLLLPSLPMWF